MSDRPSAAAEKGGCLFLALAILGLGVFLLWPAQPIPVGVDGSPLERVVGTVASVQLSGDDGKDAALEVTYRWREAEETVQLTGSIARGGGRPLVAGHSIDLWIDPAAPNQRVVPALGQKPARVAAAPRSWFGRIAGGLALGLDLFGLYATLTGGGGSRAPGARPGEDDRH